MADLSIQLKEFRLTTAQIFYHLPDYPKLLQEFIWQELDIAPGFPALTRFLSFWEKNLEGRLHSVTVASVQLVRPAHFRWARVIGAGELESRLDRTLSVGRLSWVQPLRRARSGHLNSVEVRGSKGKRLVENEIKIRGLFGPGSQRSSLFILDAEYDARGKPLRYVFYGGGWGHAVGFCQSGAMGRALKGATFAEILRSYYTGVEIGSLRY